MTFQNLKTAFCLALVGSVLCGGVVAKVRTRPHHTALVVGWRDEMNDLSTWQSLGGINGPDIFASRAGAMTLRMPQVPQGFPYTYQWGGVTRQASVDLGRYPVIVACVSRVGDGSYAHLDVAEHDFGGKPVRALRTPTLQGKGLSILDVGQAWGPQTRRVQLRLIVGGALTGASCEYAWVRFVRREDVAKLQAQVQTSSQPVRLEP